jgi:hypothetical protein
MSQRNRVTLRGVENHLPALWMALGTDSTYAVLSRNTNDLEITVYPSSQRYYPIEIREAQKLEGLKATFFRRQASRPSIPPPAPPSFFSRTFGVSRQESSPKMPIPTPPSSQTPFSIGPLATLALKCELDEEVKLTLGLTQRLERGFSWDLKLEFSGGFPERILKPRP